MWVCPEQACLAVAAESSCDDIFWAVPYSAVGCGCEQLCQLPVFYIGSHANAGTLNPVKSQPCNPLKPEVCSCLSQSFRQMYVFVGILCLILALACMGHGFAEC